MGGSGACGSGGLDLGEGVPVRSFKERVWRGPYFGLRSWVLYLALWAEGLSQVPQSEGVTSDPGPDLAWLSAQAPAGVGLIPVPWPWTTLGGQRRSQASRVPKRLALPPQPP